MSGLKRLIHEVHRRSLWQVLGIYLVGACVGYEVRRLGFRQVEPGARTAAGPLSAALVNPGPSSKWLPLERPERRTGPP